MPRKINLASILALTVSTIAPGVLSAQTYKELYSECYQGDLPERVVAACSVIIKNRVGDRYDLAMAFKNRGNAYDDKGEYELALRDYGESLAVNPRDPDVFNSRGTTRTALTQYETAIQDFDRALELAPGRAMTLSNRCFVKAVLGRLEDALTDCDEAIRLHPSRLSTLDSRGFVYLYCMVVRPLLHGGTPADNGSPLQRRGTSPASRLAVGFPELGPERCGSVRSANQVPAKEPFQFTEATIEITL
jgi:tetratricopeptide (TPR) repeat protein